MGGSKEERMVVVVLVGSTSFEALVQEACCAEVLQLLAEEGVGEVALQVGSGRPPHLLHPDLLQHVEGDEQCGKGVAPTHPPLLVSWFRFAPTLAPLLSRASLAVGHGGAGTITECLSAGVALLCVPNGGLLHAHQGELATQMEEEGRLVCCRDPMALPGALRAHFDARRKAAPLPPLLLPPEPRMFAAFLEDFMGLR